MFPETPGHWVAGIVFLLQLFFMVGQFFIALTETFCWLLKRERFPGLGVYWLMLIAWFAGFQLTPLWPGGELREIFFLCWLFSAWIIIICFGFRERIFKNKTITNKIN